MKKIRVKFILLIGCLMFLTSCSRERIYEGDYPELFSGAIHSILGVRGYEFGHGGEPWIQVLEEDDYGRKLFYYEEGRIASRLIIQRVENGYAYFYPHYNFVLHAFTEEVEEELKASNSWNEPLSDVSEFERVPIVRQKESGPISDELLIEADQLIFPDSNASRAQVTANTIFLRIDNYGRSIYFRNRAVILFQPDHTFDLEKGVFVLEERNRYNYQTELRFFMEANGWNEPWEE